MLSALAKSFNIVKGNMPLLLAAIIIDIIFVLVLLASSTYIFENIAINVQGMSLLFQEYNEKITEEVNAARDIRQILSQLPSFSGYYKGMISWAIAFFISLYFIFSFFQGINWGIAAKQAQNAGFIRYLARFFGINILWLIALALLFALSIRLSMKRPGSFVPVFSQNAVTATILALFAVMGYFAIVSFTLLAKQSLAKTFISCFAEGVRRWKQGLPAYAAALFTLALSAALTALLVKTYFFAGVLFGIIIAMPLLHFLRIFLMTAFSASGLSVGSRKA